MTKHADNQKFADGVLIIHPVRFILCIRITKVIPCNKNSRIHKKQAKMNDKSLLIRPEFEEECKEVFHSLKI